MSEWARVAQPKGAVEQIRFDISEEDAENLGRGRLEGRPVFTGQISDSTTPKGTRRDFAFYDPDKERTFEVCDADWPTFLLIHGDEEGRPEMSWPGYWRERFHQGQESRSFIWRMASIATISPAIVSASPTCPSWPGTTRSTT